MNTKNNELTSIAEFIAILLLKPKQLVLGFLIGFVFTAGYFFYKENKKNNLEKNKITFQTKVALGIIGFNKDKGNVLYTLSPNDVSHIVEMELIPKLGFMKKSKIPIQVINPNDSEYILIRSECKCSDIEDLKKTHDFIFDEILKRNEQREMLFSLQAGIDITKFIKLRKVNSELIEDYNLEKKDSFFSLFNIFLCLLVSCIFAFIYRFTVYYCSLVLEELHVKSKQL